MDGRYAIDARWEIVDSQVKIKDARMGAVLLSGLLAFDRTPLSICCLRCSRLAIDKYAIMNCGASCPFS